jgi:hypothetical protein
MPHVVRLRHVFGALLVVFVITSAVAPSARAATDISIVPGFASDNINMNCAAGVCQPSGPVAAASLTLGSLAIMLDAGNLQVRTTSGGAGPGGGLITFNVPFSSSSANLLTLSADGATSVNAPIHLTGGLLVDTTPSLALGGSLDFGAGGLVESAPVTITGNITTSGNLDFIGAVTAACTCSLTSTGGITSLHSSTTVAADNQTLTLNGTIDAFGALQGAAMNNTIIKAGAGDMRVRAGSSNALIDVTSGRTRVDTTSAARFRASGTGVIGGDGTLGSLKIDGGTVDPGATPGSVGTLSTIGGGSLRFTSGVLHVDMTTAASDQVAVGSLFDLTGASLDLAVASLPPVGTAVTIIDKIAGPPNTTATFVGLPEGAAFTAGGGSFHISYVGGTGDDVTLTRFTPAASTTTLAQDSASTTSGGAVTFTGSVSSTGIAPGGTVTFLDGATVLGSSAVSASGSASLTTSSMAVGTHSITARYDGDTSHAASTSSAAAHTVTAPPTPPTTTTPVDPTLGVSPITASASCITPRTRNISFRYTLESRARVTYTLSRRVLRTGFMLGACRTALRPASSVSPARFATLAHASATLAAGARSVALTTLISRQRLSPGIYRLAISAKRADGVVSRTRVVVFIVHA